MVSKAAPLRTERWKSVRVEVALEQEDRELLQHASEALNQKGRYVIAEPMKRFGYTGSRLFIAYFDRERAGYPYVVKINKRSKIDAEWKAIKRVKTFFTDIRGVELLGPHGDRAALVYPLIRSGPGHRVEEFKDVLFAGLSKTSQPSRLRRALSGVYETCCTSAHSSTRRGFQLGHAYRRYKRGSPPSRRLAHAFRGHTARDTFMFLGAKIVDPRAAYDRIASRKIVGSVAPAVHGDLHPSNVIIDEKGKPHLIDFAWGDQKTHVLKDFVLLESSLRFLHFPEYVNLEDQLTVDRALLQEYKGVDLLEEFDTGSELDAYYRRLGFLLREIRRQARRACGPDYSFEDEYLHAQFLVLYGLLKYETYRFQVTARALGVLARHLTS